MVKVFVIDSHPIVRYGLSTGLSKNTEIKIVGDASDLNEALPKIESAKPDLLIMDISKPYGNLDVLAGFQQKYPKTKVLILTDSDRSGDFLRAIRAGAKGYLLKTLDLEELIDAIRIIASGDAVVYTSMATKVLVSPQNEDGKSGTANVLSRREKEMLRLVASGRSNKEIAGQCFISETTVKAHLGQILVKLGVKNRAQAVAVAMEKDLLNNFACLIA